jgi:hypothetical protein
MREYIIQKKVYTEGKINLLANYIQKYVTIS